MRHIRQRWVSAALVSLTMAVVSSCNSQAGAGHATSAGSTTTATAADSSPASPASSAATSTPVAASLDPIASFIYDTGAYFSGHLIIVDHGKVHAVRLPYADTFAPFPNHAGTLIAFDESSSGPDTASVAVMNRDGSHPRVIPGTQGCFAGPWFPDDTRLAINCGPGTSPPWTVRYATVHGVLPGGFSDPVPGSSPFLSPDGKQLAYADRNKIFVVDLQGKILHTLTGAEALNALLAWSPDGKQLLFAATDGPLSIRTIPIAGGAPTVIKKAFDPIGHASSAVYSPDGSRILISGGGDQMNNIWIAQKDGSGLEVQIPTGDGSDAAWLP